jgi:hypothetical protein
MRCETGADFFHTSAMRISFTRAISRLVYVRPLFMSSSEFPCVTMIPALINGSMLLRVLECSGKILSRLHRRHDFGAGRFEFRIDGRRQPFRARRRAGGGAAATAAATIAVTVAAAPAPRTAEIRQAQLPQRLIAGPHSPHATPGTLTMSSRLVTEYLSSSFHARISSPSGSSATGRP